MKMSEVQIPMDVPADLRALYRKNYHEMTHGVGRLMLFAGDQKIEHLNDDFYGEGIHPDDADPEHLFRIASGGKIGVLATQLGLIARYGKDYSDVPYLVKLNSKTHLVKTKQADPYSEQMYDVEQVAEFRENSGLRIMAVGYTIYLGSDYEASMLSQAAQVVYEAHQFGLLSVLWIYPRGQAVPDEKDPHLIAGATGTASCLGSDFVKVNAPKKEGKPSAEWLKEAVKAAGRTKVVCAGGSSKAPRDFLQELHDQIHIGGVSGNATGRNVHQKGLDDAVRFTNAICAVTVEDKSVDEAWGIYQGGV